jgi:hypothetical protein
MLRRFIVFSTSRSIEFRLALKHCVVGHALATRKREHVVWTYSLPTTHPLPLIHGTSARSLGSSTRKATLIYRILEATTNFLAFFDRGTAASRQQSGG